MVRGVSPTGHFCSKKRRKPACKSLLGALQDVLNIALHAEAHIHTRRKLMAVQLETKKDVRATWLLAGPGDADGSGATLKPSCVCRTRRKEMLSSAVCAPVPGERRGNT